MAEIVLDSVDKVYPDGTRAVSGLDLAIDDGEFMVLVGPSGCGKTTALRMVAGLEQISAGEVRIGGRRVNEVQPKDRDIAMVFQTYALYPHMSVYDNMGFGLKLRKLPKAEIDRRVRHAASMLGLQDLLARKPRALSGGQRQRVAMGRAIVREPQAFLMDEPLSNLDAKLRVQMRAEIAGLQHDLKVTTVYVTHDQVEAMTMGDRVAVLRKGELQQVSPPQHLYDSPLNLFVGGFIGSPAMNMMAARVVASGEDIALRLGESIELPVPAEVLEARPAIRGLAGRDVVCGIRPENLQDPAFAPGSRPRIPGFVTHREPLGSEIVVHAEIDARPAATEEMRELSEDRGDVAVEQLAKDQATLVCRFAPGSRVSERARIEIAVDTSGLHVFDPETGLAVHGAG